MSTALANEVSELISIDEIWKVLENAVYMSKLAAYMQRLSSESPAFNYKFLPLMSAVASLFFHPSSNADNAEHELSEKRLDCVLKGWGMKRHYIEGDGNCCFSAVAFSLSNNAALILEYNSEFFASLGINPNDDLQSRSMQLRNLTVTEWTNNSQEYEGFVPEVNIADEAKKFLVSGYFYGDLADTIVLALSNTLGLPFIIFSSSICQPVITITPRNLKAPTPIYLAFKQCGPGHYDAAVVCSTGSKNALPVPICASDEKAAESSCSCGKNDKMNKSHCHPTQSKYTTIVKCICVKNNKHVIAVIKDQLYL